MRRWPTPRGGQAQLAVQREDEAPGWEATVAPARAAAGAERREEPAVPGRAAAGERALLVAGARREATAAAVETAAARAA